MRYTIIFILVFLPFIILAQPYQAQKITTGPGPEDLVLVRLDTIDLILASCAPRSGNTGEAGIFQIDLEKAISRQMPRIGEPDSILFMPHGIAFAELEGLPYLYVITHDEHRGLHPIVRYSIEFDQLIFDTVYSHPLLMSPNALTVLEDGSFYVVNDSRNRTSILEKILPLKRSTVVYRSSMDNWSIAADNIAMATGITHHHNTLFVSATRQNKVLTYKIDNKGLLPEGHIEVKGPDNLRLGGNRLYIASHTKPMKLARHILNPEKHAPSQIMRYNLTSKSIEQVFSDSGSQINGASVGLPFNDLLIAGQIVNAYVLVLPMP